MFQALDIAPRSTPDRWWGTHERNIGSWEEYRRLMWVKCFLVDTRVKVNYDGKVDPWSIIIIALQFGNKFQNKSGYMGLSTQQKQFL